MRPTLIVLAALVGFALASVLALYSYGRFAERMQGEPSFSLPVADADTPLDRLVGPMVAARPEQSGLVLLAENLDAFAIRALTARRAGRSLDLQYYIWKDDLTGRLLGSEIVKAADRGVRVRLLLDDINAHGHDRTYLTLDTHPNIEVRLYNPSRNRDGAFFRAIEMVLRAVNITRRMHNKAWIVDGRLIIVGGRNIGDAYFDADETANFHDLDMVALGSAVQQAEGIFDEFWNSKAVVPISALGTPREADLPALRKVLGSSTADPRARPYLARVAENETISEMLASDGAIQWTGQARIISDPPEKVIGAGQENWLMNALAPMLRSATRNLEIISPYFIPGDTGTSALTEMAGRGVTVAVLTNSLAATDVAAVHGAYANYRESLIGGGVHLFELKPYDERSQISLFGSSSASLHTKAFTVDDGVGFIGSFNFDPRSVSLNSEMGIVFEDEDLVRQVRHIFADMASPQKSYRVLMEDGEIAWRDQLEGAARTLHEEPEAGFWRRLVATVIGLLPIESQL
jgi:putative cardiolipin synthase